MHGSLHEPGLVQLEVTSALADPNEGLRYLLAGQRELGGSVTVTVVPEPATALLLGAGLAALAGFALRRQTRA